MKLFINLSISLNMFFLGEKTVFLKIHFILNEFSIEDLEESKDNWIFHNISFHLWSICMHFGYVKTMRKIVNNETLDFRTMWSEPRTKLIPYYTDFLFVTVILQFCIWSKVIIKWREVSLRTCKSHILLTPWKQWQSKLIQKMVYFY